MAINSITLADMEVPKSYLESLSKNGRLQRLPTEWSPQWMCGAEKPTPNLATTQPDLFQSHHKDWSRT